jgi:hypothetical protein
MRIEGQRRGDWEVFMCALSVILSWSVVMAPWFVLQMIRRGQGYPVIPANLRAFPLTCENGVPIHFLACVGASLWFNFDFDFSISIFNRNFSILICQFQFSISKSSMSIIGRVRQVFLSLSEAFDKFLSLSEGFFDKFLLLSTNPILLSRRLQSPANYRWCET